MASLALSLILGADDVSDINLLDPLVATGMITCMPSDSTSHRRHQELADLGDHMRAPLAAAMNTIRTQAWNHLGLRNPAARTTVDNPLIIDIDATDITAHSDKELASATWKKHFGFHPLCAFIDLGDDHGGEVLSIKLRTGRAGANTVADHLDVLEVALDVLPDHADGKPWGRRLLICPDAGGGTQKLIEHIESLGHGYLMGFRGSDAIRVIASTTGDGPIISIAAVITRHARRLILRADRAVRWQSLLRRCWVTSSIRHPPDAGR